MAPRKTPADGAPPGADHPRAIFTPEDIKLIRKLASQGWLQTEIAEHMTEILVGRKDRKKSEPVIRKQVIGKIVRGESYAEE